MVLVTGATGLLGEAIARRFARDGVRLWLGYHEGEERARALVESLSTQAAVSAVPLDVSRTESVESAVRTIVEAHGRVDVLVHAAGVMKKAHLRFCTDADLETTFSVNVLGAIRCARAVIPGMSRAGRGRIILVGSRSADVGMVSYSLYTASKAALGGLCRSAAKEYAAAGITVNVVAPAKLDDGTQTDDPLKAKYPMRRFIGPGEVAETIAFLASDAAASITGQTITVDGASTV